MRGRYSFPATLTRKLEARQIRRTALICRHVWKCEGFRMPAALRDGTTYSAVGVRKPPREETALGNVRPCGKAYGDLSAAGELADLDRADATSCATAKRLTNERRLASNSTSRPTICDGWRISGRILPWPVERQRARRIDLQDCDAVTRCRS